MAKKKFYAVAAGRTVGIFPDWPSAEKQVKGYSGAKFKGFTTEVEAKEWLENPQYTRKEKRCVPHVEQKRAGTDDAGKIVVYTDGGAINNPGPGGYGIVIDEDGDVREVSGGFRLTTNNRMEMMAAIVALKSLAGSDREINLYSDSSYLVNGVTKGWAKKWQKNKWRKSDGSLALNIDLWQQLLELLEGTDVNFHWVKGHAGNTYNERCDRLAVTAAKNSPIAADEGYEHTM